MLFSTTTVVTLLLAFSNVAEAKTSAVKTTAVKTSTSTSTKPTSTKVGKAPMVDGNKYIFRVDTANDLAKPGKITPKYLSSLSKTGVSLLFLFFCLLLTIIELYTDESRPFSSLPV